MGKSSTSQVLWNIDSIWETDIETSCVWGQPGLHNNTLYNNEEDDDDDDLFKEYEEGCKITDPLAYDHWVDVFLKNVIRKMYLKLYNVDIEWNFYYPSADFSLLLRFYLFTMASSSVHTVSSLD